MPDRYYAKITFPSAACDKVRAAIQKTLEKGGILYRSASGITVIVHDYVPNGEFEDLEACLIQNQIPFDRYSGAFAEQMPRVRKYRLPKLDIEYNVLEENGNPVSFVPVSKLRRLLALKPQEAILELKILINQADPPVPPLVA